MIFDSNIYESNLKRLKHSVEIMMKNKVETPLFMSFLITNRCTLRCKHCFNHKNKSANQLLPDDSELTIDQYEKISKSIGTILKAIFAGGEPFLRDDIHEIVGVFVKNNKVINTDICTNGQDAQKIITQVEKILGKNPYTKFSLAFSLDGFEEYHNEIRGKDTFTNCIETWKSCKKLQDKHKNFEMYISTTMNTINESIIPQFIHWCVKELNPAMVALLKTRQNPRGGDHLKRISLDNFHKAIDCIKNEVKLGNMGDLNKPQTYFPIYIYDFVAETLKNSQRYFHCYAGTYGGFIDYNGNVGACEVLPYVANLKDYDYNFKALWNDPKNSSLHGQANFSHDCKICTHETEGIIPSLYFGDNWCKMSTEAHESLLPFETPLI